MAAADRQDSGRRRPDRLVGTLNVEQVTASSVRCNERAAHRLDTCCRCAHGQLAATLHPAAPCGWGFSPSSTLLTIGLIFHRGHGDFLFYLWQQWRDEDSELRHAAARPSSGCSPRLAEYGLATSDNRDRIGPRSRRLAGEPRHRLRGRARRRAPAFCERRFAPSLAERAAACRSAAAIPCRRRARTNVYDRTLRATALRWS